MLDDKLYLDVMSLSIFKLDFFFSLSAAVVDKAINVI